MQTDDNDTIGRATYSPEDNKLRIYPEGVRVDSVLTTEEYAAFKAAGYKWASKQECFVAARWTPTSEDWAMRLCGEIDDEDYSYEERSADRAERFGDYRDRRRSEAGGLADTFASGPDAFGHQNRQRAERRAARQDRHRTHAVSQWSKAEYWQQRTAGVIAHALHKSSATVRRGRILTLEAEQRKHNKSRAEYAEKFAKWLLVPTLDGADEPIREEDGRLHAKAAGKLAYSLACGSSGWSDYKHPRRDLDESKYNSGRKSLYCLLTDASDPITPAEAAALWLNGKTVPETETSGSARLAAHYELRLAYERAMLAEEGGTAAEAEMEPGGWICTGNRTGSALTDVASGWKQIQSVNKSHATGRVVSVKVWGRTSSMIAERNGKPILVSVNIERLPEGAYRAPTDEEREAFAAAKKAKKAATPTVPTINPTHDDARRLQLYFDEGAKKSARHRQHSTPAPRQIEEMTQREFSARLKHEHVAIRTYSLGGATFKIRMRRYYLSASADAVVVITDKPQKPLPLDWDAIESEAQPAEKVGA